MRTRTELHLEKLNAQIEYNQTHINNIRKECYPERWTQMLTNKQKLARIEGSVAYRYREARLTALAKMEVITDRLVVRYYTIMSKYNL